MIILECLKQLKRTKTCVPLSLASFALTFACQRKADRTSANAAMVSSCWPTVNRASKRLSTTGNNALKLISPKSTLSKSDSCFRMISCAVENPCSQKCTDTGVAVECSCHSGYQLGDDEKTCYGNFRKRKFRLVSTSCNALV